MDVTATVLVVDDQERVRDNIQQALEETGYQVLAAGDGREALAVPFIFLTAHAMDSDVRYGKQLGADDYLVKPFQLEDLLAAVQGKLRRARQLAQRPVQPQSVQPLGQRAIRAGRLHIDPGQHRAWLDERPIQLSAKEFTPRTPRPTAGYCHFPLRVGPSHTWI